MASQILRDISEKIRKANAKAPAGNIDLLAMRAQFEVLQAKLELPDDILREDLSIGGVPGCRITAPGARTDRAILYFHGGGYVMGSINSHQELMARLARQVGVAVYGVDYRLAPEHVWPAALEDAISAWDGLSEFGLTPEQTVIAGDSAGGGLSLALLFTLRDRGKQAPAGAVLMSPWTDLTFSGASCETRADADPSVNVKGLTPMAQAYYASADPKAATISPVFGDLKGLPPLLMQVGDHEILLDDAVRLHQRATDSGVPSMLHIFDEAFHVFQSVPMLPEAAEAVKEVSDFCNRLW